MMAAKLASLLFLVCIFLASSILCFFIIGGLFLFNPVLTLLVISILLSHISHYFFNKPPIKKHGDNTAKMMRESLKDFK